MGNKFTISIDAMGGDLGPSAVISGIDLFASTNLDVHFLIYGDESICLPLISNASHIDQRFKLIHTPGVISSSMQPSKALRGSKNSSMFGALEAVKHGDADAMISSGNTGALMVLSKFVLGSLQGVDRPGIVSILPVSDSICPVFLDLGANVECNASDLIRLAYMGIVFASAVLNIDNPRVGILNIGTEEIKGRNIEKEAHKILSDSGINFIGYIEPHGLLAGDADVIVTDGFTGNILIKTAESVLTLMKNKLATTFSANIFAKFISLLSMRYLKKAAKSFDDKNHNGAMFIGTDGIVVKSHGRSDAEGFANALNVTFGLIKSDINSSIKKRFSDAGLNDSFVSGIKKKLGL